MPDAPPVNGVLETAVYCDDLAAARYFYSDILGLRLVSEEAGRDLFYAVGRTMLLIFAPSETAKGGTLPSHGSHGPGHFALQIDDSKYHEWGEHLRHMNVSIEHEHVWAADGARSIYFRDPAGNLLELVTRAMWEKHFLQNRPG